jgi:hypothetical protein
VRPSFHPGRSPLWKRSYTQSGGAPAAGGVAFPQPATRRAGRDAGEHGVLRGCRTLRGRVLRWAPQLVSRDPPRLRA